MKRFAAVVLSLLVATSAWAATYSGSGGSRGGGSSSGGSSYSGGGGSRGGSSYSSPSYSAPRSPSPSPSYSTPRSSPSQSVPRPSYDSGAGRAQSQQRSQTKYESAQPKPTPVAPATTPVPVAAPVRSGGTIYAPTRLYVPSRTVVVYRDGWDNTFLQYATMLWFFHHWDTVDRSRFSDARLREMELEIARLKAQGVKQNPNYIDAQAEKAATLAKEEMAVPKSGGFRLALSWIVGAAAIMVVFGLGYWFIFVRRIPS